MAKYRITAPDGGTYEVTAPDTATEAEVMAYAQQNYKAHAAPKPAAADLVKNDAITQGAKNFAKDSTAGAVLSGIGGLVRGAGSIGATLAAPFDIAKDALGGKGLSLESNRQRRAAMDSALADLGADPESALYKGGKLVSEIAGTAGAGNLLAKPVQALVAARGGAQAAPVLNGIAQGLQTGGFRIGDVAGLPARAATRIGTGAAVGGVSAGLANPEDAGLGAVVGGAAPGVIKGAAAAGDTVLSGIRKAVGSVTPEVQALAQRAEQLGIRIPADRLVDSKPMNAVAAGLNYVPFSGRAATEEAMTTQLNRALSRTFGQDTPNVTAALRRAEADLGAKFDNFLRNNTVAVDMQFLGDLAQASNQAAQELGAEGASIIGRQVDDILSKATTGQIDGQAAYNIKRTLDRIGKRNSPEAWYALDLKGKLMDALNRSVGPQAASEFAGVRQQYGNMLSLQKLATNGVEGELSVARLANMKNINNPNLQELADIAAQFVKPREGQHGAAQRAVAGLAATWMGGPAALAAAAAGGRATNMALNSAPVRSMLVPPAPGLLGAPPPMGLIGQFGYRAAPLLAAQDN